MLVATVTAPRRPAIATTAASRSCCLAFSTEWGIPRFLRRPESSSDFSTEVVPTSTGWPFSWRATMSSTTAVNFPATFL